MPDRPEHSSGLNPEAEPPKQGLEETTPFEGRFPWETDTGGGAHLAGRMNDALIHARFGNYEVKSLLGEGGFGAVYKAVDTALGRDVAIKFLKQTVDPDWKASFLQEGKALAALSKHPAIVEIHQWGEHEDCCYLVLEYVESGAQQLLESHPNGLPVTTALRLVAECAEALQEAHKRGIVHRDIKPANILVEADTGAAKLADFGLARLRRLGGSGSVHDLSGSPPYMAPEQLTSDEIDPRSDIFSLGVALYEMLSGRRPYEGDSPRAILEAIRQDQRTPFAERRPDLPEAIQELVDKAISYDPAKRFPTAGEFARKLRNVLGEIERSGQPAETPPQGTARPQTKSRYLVPAVGLVLAAVVAAVTSLLLHGGRPETVWTPALAAAETQLDEGRFAAAVSAFQAALEETTASDRALQGLLLALVESGRTEEAVGVLAKLEDPALKTEGQVLLALESGKGNPRALVKDAAGGAGSGYTELLLAQLDVSEGKYQEAVHRLSDKQAESFAYAYQHAEALCILGQAYYHLEEYDNAEQTFAQLEEATARGHAPVARAYLKSIRQKQDVERRQEVREAAVRIRERMDAGAAADSPADLWTSRPLTFYLLPADVGSSRYAVTSGLADILTMLLGDALDEDTPLNLVDRELIAEILQEQELSALLGSKANQLALGRLLGSRLIMRCGFVRLEDGERLTIKIDDAETGERIPVGAIALKRAEGVETTIGRVANDIRQAVQKAYPVQGRVHQGANGPVINVGTRVGLTEDMIFDVYADAEASPVPGVRAMVTTTPGANESAVEIVGMDAKDLPDSEEAAWFVRERSNRG